MAGLRISGRTEDGRRVLAGWFPLLNSEGIPLDLLLSHLKGRGLLPDWVDFIEEALGHGWNMDSLRSRIEVSVGDVHGPLHRDEVLRRFDEYISKRK